jgi:7-keto-8-aminopelargonate synthetase-like enzyme
LVPEFRLNNYDSRRFEGRFPAGTLSLHKEPEETIAEFKSTEAAITFTSGYITDATVVAALSGEGDYVYSDTLNHASIVDGFRLSKEILMPLSSIFPVDMTRCCFT